MSRPGTLGRSEERTETAEAVLWITRMMDDGNDQEVASVGYTPRAVALNTFNHARRVLGRDCDLGSEALRAGDLLVTVLGNRGDGAEDDPVPLRVPAGRAEWFLDEWLKVPRASRTDLPTTIKPSR